MSDQTKAVKARRKAGRRGLLMAAAVVSVAIAAGAIGYQVGKDNRSDPVTSTRPDVGASLAPSPCATPTGPGYPPAPTPTVTITVTAPPESAETDSVAPAAGEGLDEGAIWLSDLDPVENRSSAQSGMGSVSGTEYLHAITIGNCGRGSPTEVGYNLDRKWTRLKATVGMNDKDASDERARAVFLLDGKQVAETEVMAVGATYPLDLDVTGKLRLVVAVYSTVPADCTDMTLADPKLTG